MARRIPRKIRTKKALRRCMKGRSASGRGKCLAAYNRKSRRRRRKGK